MRYAFLIALSIPGAASAADPPAKKDAPAPKVVPEAEQGEGVSLTIYNQNFVIVKERRKLDLVQGRGVLRFKDVAATIVPDTVQFGTLRDPGLARVVEQNYEFDLVSADKLFGKYIDRDIGLVTKDGDSIKGTLLSYDDNAIVLKTANGIDMVPRYGNVKDVQFSALPGGLLTRPTLVWALDSKQAGKELVKVAYRANGMSWRVDYRARLNQAGDRMDLGGWVTVMNGTGTTFSDAKLKLLAGDVNLTSDNQPTPNIVPTSGADPSDPKRSGFIEKAFADYHLYELGRATTIREAETKQIELIDVRNIPVVRKYVANPAHFGKQVAVAVEFDNSEKHAAGLGIPLPKGPVRVFQRDKDNELEFSGNDLWDHTPKDEAVTVRLGFAFDLVAEQKILAQRVMGRVTETDYEVRMRNHKNDSVKIDLLQWDPITRNGTVPKHSHQFIRRNENMLVFFTEVKADSETVVTYTIRHEP